MRFINKKVMNDDEHTGNYLTIIHLDYTFGYGNILGMTFKANKLKR